jgi:GNAT superfamily N-acetyltransferase
MTRGDDIRPAVLPRDLDVVRRLFADYAASLGFSLAFQLFDEEHDALPGAYAPPAGRLLIAWPEGRAAGCVALRPLQAGLCEMKRLYVCPAERATGLGRRLAERICVEARTAGYRRMRLDTLASMAAARRLYASLGFREIAPYCFNPFPDAVFLELDLS